MGREDVRRVFGAVARLCNDDVRRISGAGRFCRQPEPISAGDRLLGFNTLA